MEYDQFKNTGRGRSKTRKIGLKPSETLAMSTQSTVVDNVFKTTVGGSTI